MKYLIIFSLTFFVACNCPSGSSGSADELLKADRDFSQLSLDSGRNKAFAAYAHDSVVLLRPNSMPVVGKTALVALLQRPDTGYQLTWEPLYANLAESGEVGYTYGIYTFRVDTAIEKGTYATIWRKTVDGWKYVLDVGNEGLGKTAQ